MLHNFVSPVIILAANWAMLTCIRLQVYIKINLVVQEL